MKNLNCLLIALIALPGMMGLPFNAVAQSASATSATSTPPSALSSAQAGEKKATLCIGCHGIPGYQASFPEVHKVPMLAGQNAKYIVAALGQYKKGDRKHPTMRAVAVSLSEQDMTDLGAFYSTQAAAQPVPATPTANVPTNVVELLKKGNCASCHGANFSAPIDASYPKLAGQHADYLYTALKAYQTDKNPQVGRSNAIMMGMARPYSTTELKALANYFASLPSELKTVQQSRWR
jgi:cytochrome c553